MPGSQPKSTPYPPAGPAETRRTAPPPRLAPLPRCSGNEEIITRTLLARQQVTNALNRADIQCMALRRHINQLRDQLDQRPQRK